METDVTPALPIRGGRGRGRAFEEGSCQPHKQRHSGIRGIRSGAQGRADLLNKEDHGRGRRGHRELNNGNRGTGAGSQDRSKESTAESRYRGTRTGLESQLRCHRHSGRQRRFVSVLEFDLRARWTIQPSWDETLQGRGFGIGIEGG